MNITVLHGPGEVSKRTQLLQLKSKYPSTAVQVLDYKQSGIGGIKNALISNSLFDDQRLVIVENVADDLDLEQLQVQDPSVSLAILGANLSAAKTLIKSASKLKARVLTFEGEKETSAFPFLDALLEKKKEALVELKKLQNEYGDIYVLTMIYYGLRRNLLPLPASSFIQNKIKSQKQKYTNKDFEEIYHQVLETEYKIKTGLADPTAVTFLVEKIVNNRF